MLLFLVNPFAFSMKQSLKWKKNHLNSAWDLFSNLDFIGLQNNFFFRMTVTLNEHSLIVVFKFLCLEQEKLGKWHHLEKIVLERLLSHWVCYKLQKESRFLSCSFLFCMLNRLTAFFLLLLFFLLGLRKENDLTDTPFFHCPPKQGKPP